MREMASLTVCAALGTCRGNCDAPRPRKHGHQSSGQSTSDGHSGANAASTTRRCAERRVMNVTFTSVMGQQSGAGGDGPR
jgi:hypothetical protein